MNSSIGKPSINRGLGTRFCFPLMKITMDDFFRSRRARFSAAVRMRFGLRFFAFVFAFVIGFTFSDYSSRYCSGDLPTRFMTRGYGTVGIDFSIRSTRI
jgi:hypothetical protein